MRNDARIVTFVWVVERIRMHRIRRAAIAAGACLAGLAGLAWPAAASTPPTAFVDVSVATVWTSPDSPRPVDRPALTNPVDLDGWLSSMTLAQKLDLTAGNRTQTQALYGQQVYVLATQGDWAEVAVPG